LLYRLPLYLFLALGFISCATSYQPTTYSRIFSEDSKFVWDVFQERLTRNGLLAAENSTSVGEGFLEFYLELSDQDVMTYAQGPHDSNLSHGIVTIRAWVENLEAGGSRVLVESNMDAYVYERRTSASFSGGLFDAGRTQPRFSTSSGSYIPITLKSNGVLEYELLGYSREKSVELSRVQSIQAEFARIKLETGRK